MAKTREREQAQALRKAGSSINTIAKQLQVSKSTVSVWCRDIELSKQALAKLEKSSGHRSASALLAFSESKRQARSKATKNNERLGRKMVGKLSKRDVVCVGLGLYWGEGYKRGNREFGFTNSDPDMIIFYIKWLQYVFKITEADLILRVSINSQHKNRIKDVESFWSNITRVPLSQFTKSSLIKTSSKKQFSNFNEHFGTLRVKVRLGSDYREQVLGAIKHISS